MFISKKLHAASSISLALLLLGPVGISFAQDNSHPVDATSSDTVPNAVQIVGPANIKPGIKGVLTLAPEDVVFTASEIRSRIPYKDVIQASIGDEKMEGGGAAGTVSRHLPMGAGTVAGLAESKKVDLLTIEYRDDHEAYHGAVFILPKQTAESIQQKIAARISPPSPSSAATCTTPSSPNSVLISPITAEGVDLPAEYRVLMYERLYTALKTSKADQTYFRFGDTSAGPGCTTLTLHLSVTAFKKGNQTLRASTGPLGLFVGTTSMTYNVKLDDATGRTVLNTTVKKGVHGGSDSLGLGKQIAKDISKRIDKAMTKSRHGMV